MKVKKRKQHRQKLEREYKEAMKLFGLSDDDNVVSKKTNLDKILKK